VSAEGPIMARTVDGGLTCSDVPILAGHLEDIERDMLERVASRTFNLVVTPNVDQLVLLGLDSRARVAFDGADVGILDGQPLVWLARMLGAKNVSRHTGADLLSHAARWSSKHGLRVVVAGGQKGAAEAAANALRRTSPGSLVMHLEIPQLEDEEADSRPAIESLIQLKPDIVFVCLGFPKQENWILKNRSALPPAVYIGAGAAVDFSSGRKSRAPLFMQRAGMEWLYRLMLEPRRLARRYLGRGWRFIPILVRSLRKGKGNG
jgi:N-acetylglucosaminyldiphosphoundecaprenol N-acetyl-beta-D-mannosaminyltransferase